MWQVVHGSRCPRIHLASPQSLYHCYVTARVPRVDYPDHKTKQVKMPWTREGSRVTLLFEQVATNPGAGDAHAGCSPHHRNQRHATLAGGPCSTWPRPCPKWTWAGSRPWL
ncbi:hypothetical protein DFAR_1540023 [Desulfarculales bacterium]